MKDICVIGELHWKLFCFFFFKEKAAYEVEYGRVGSEMCIRDRDGRYRIAYLRPVRENI